MKNLCQLLILWMFLVDVLSAQNSDRISFSSFQPHGWDIYILEPGTEPVALTQHPALDYGAIWSPDSRYVVFTSERDGSPDLFVLDMKNGDEKPHKLISSDAMEDQAVFTPDGRHLIFVSTRDGNSDLFRIEFDPNNTATMNRAEKLTDHPRADLRPAVSNDGQYVVFTSNRDAKDKAHPVYSFALLTFGDLYRLNLKDKSLVRLTDAEGWDGSASFSRDGKLIYFYSERKGDPQLFQMNLDGSSAVPIGAKRSAIAVTEHADGQFVYETTRGNDDECRWELRRRSPEGVEESVDTGALYCHGPKAAPKGGRLLCHGSNVSIFEKDSGTSFPGPSLAEPSTVSLNDIGLDAIVYRVRNPFSAPISPAGNHYFLLGKVAIDANLVNIADGTKKSLIKLGDRESLKKSRRSIMGPSWSPDGRSLVFSVKEFADAKTQGEIWRVSLSDGSLNNLPVGSVKGAGMPDIGAGGSKIVFAGRERDEDKKTDLFLMNADGTNITNLTQSKEDRENFPALSPDGTMIAYASDRNGWLDETTDQKTMDIFVAKVSDKGEMSPSIQVTQTPGQEGHVRFSPDGDWLIYTSGVGDVNDEYPVLSSLIFSPQLYGEIWLYRISDGKQVRLTHNKWEDGAPYWVPALH